MIEQRELRRISSLLIFVTNRERTLLLRTHIDRINTIQRLFNYIEKNNFMLTFINLLHQLYTLLLATDYSPQWIRVYRKDK